ncbi:hypothetical protein [Bartonella sp. MM73XJBT.G]|nr:hypothetical protein [Bartonella sp. MM73XJBT.G]
MEQAVSCKKRLSYYNRLTAFETVRKRVFFSFKLYATQVFSAEECASV